MLTRALTSSLEGCVCLRVPSLPPEQAGSFRRFISHIEPRNISEFSYRYGDTARASIYASFQAKGAEDGAGVMQALRDDGCTVMDLTRRSPM